MLDGGEELTVGTAGTADVLKCLDKFLFLPAITEAGVEVRGCQAEQPLVLVRSAAVSRLLVLEVGEHRLQSVQISIVTASSSFVNNGKGGLT